MGKTQTERKTSGGCASKLRIGSVLRDTFGGRWHLGKTIGAGGFGDIYLVSKDSARTVPADSKYVAKVELHSNGPLFVEVNFYLRVGQKKMIQNWKKERGLKHLGMPCYHAFGSHIYKEERFRFLVMERFGSDINSIFIKNGRLFSIKTVFTLGLQILDILEYIHYHGYIHADIKGSNLCLGFGKGKENVVYLLDFGLACLYVDRTGLHKEFVQDLRRAHDGTLEYTSRDAHDGAHSRRGDLEVLGYNMVQWLAGRLPWESDLADPERVAASKNTYMSSISMFMEECFSKGNEPEALIEYLQYVANLGFTAKPDYERLRSMLRQGLRSSGLVDDGKLNIDVAPARKRGCKRKSDAENSIHVVKILRDKSGVRKPCAPVQPACDRKTRQRFTTEVGFDWVKVLQSHPERDARPLAKPTKPGTVKRQVVEDVDERLRKVHEDPRSNPTPAMLELMRRRKRSVSPNSCSGWVSRTGTLGHGGRRRRPSTPGLRRKRSPSIDEHRSMYTPAMEEVMRRKLAGECSNYEPPMTAMSRRAERIRNRANYLDSSKLLELTETLNKVSPEKLRKKRENVEEWVNQTVTACFKGDRCDGKNLTKDNNSAMSRNMVKAAARRRLGFVVAGRDSSNSDSLSSNNNSRRRVETHSPSPPPSESSSDFSPSMQEGLQGNFSKFSWHPPTPPRWTLTPEPSDEETGVDPGKLLPLGWLVSKLRNFPFYSNKEVAPESTKAKKNKIYEPAKPEVAYTRSFQNKSVVHSKIDVTRKSQRRLRKCRKEDFVSRRLQKRKNVESLVIKEKNYVHVKVQRQKQGREKHVEPEIRRSQRVQKKLLSLENHVQAHSESPPLKLVFNDIDCIKALKYLESDTLDSTPEPELRRSERIDCIKALKYLETDSSPERELRRSQRIKTPLPWDIIDREEAVKMSIYGSEEDEEVSGDSDSKDDPTIIFPLSSSRPRRPASRMSKAANPKPSVLKRPVTPVTNRRNRPREVSPSEIEFLPRLRSSRHLPDSPRVLSLQLI